MDRSDVINLISITQQQDEYGQWVDTPTSKQVFCQVESVGQREFFEAGRNGLNPQFKFTLFGGDYNNEPLVEYQGNQYSVYRTYLTKSDKMELYVERKGGTNA
jgi:SPP1 family predicted phage head-tail adaptor